MDWRNARYVGNGKIHGCGTEVCGTSTKNKETYRLQLRSIATYWIPASEGSPREPGTYVTTVLADDGRLLVRSRIWDNQKWCKSLADQTDDVVAWTIIHPYEVENDRL